MNSSRALTRTLMCSIVVFVCIGNGTELRAEVLPSEECEGMFGRPSEVTGMAGDRCSGRCVCGDGTFEPPVYSEDDIRGLEAWVLLNPPALLATDPYAEAHRPTPRPERVCGVVPESLESKTYLLQSFDSVEAARDAGGWITHTGACGVCSSLADLAVYMRETDLATPVRSCALANLVFGSKEAHLECLEAIGFQRPCAQVWYYNTQHTRKECSRVCLAELGADYHDKDGSLNDCIRCDEDKSGPVFKAVSGRTRRNSGLPSALCRPCNTVSRILHRYPPDR